MPDIAMCANGQDCPRRSHCFRFVAVPDERWQSWMDFYPGPDCPPFVPAKHYPHYPQRETDDE